MIAKVLNRVHSGN